MPRIGQKKDIDRCNSQVEMSMSEKLTIFILLLILLTMLVLLAYKTVTLPL
jgi:hypothetical protein